jgi:hypothetical protein
MEHFNQYQVDFPDEIPITTADIQVFALKTPCCPKPCTAPLERQNLRHKSSPLAPLDVFSPGEHEYARGRRKFRRQHRQIRVLNNLGFANPTSNPQPRHPHPLRTVPRTRTHCHQPPRMLSTGLSPTYIVLSRTDRAKIDIFQTQHQTLKSPHFPQ